MASRDISQDLIVGHQLGHYRIVEKIDRGGMGEVYRAHDIHLARDVAIKVLPSGTLNDASTRKHFHKEALALSRLNHPNIATIYDFDTQQGVDFLVMEFIRGTTLTENLAGGPLPEKKIIALGTQLAEGLRCRSCGRTWSSALVAPRAVDEFDPGCRKEQKIVAFSSEKSTRGGFCDLMHPYFSPRPPRSGAFLVGRPEKSTRVVARPTFLCHHARLISSVKTR
jgi:Protein kinase domain